jgi:hypothetical protein
VLVLEGVRVNTGNTEDHLDWLLTEEFPFPIILLYNIVVPQVSIIHIPS